MILVIKQALSEVYWYSVEYKEAMQSLNLNERKPFHPKPISTEKRAGEKPGELDSLRK